MGSHLKIRFLLDEPPDPVDGLFLQLRMRNERVAGDEHAQPERHQLDARRRGRRLHRDELQQQPHLVLVELEPRDAPERRVEPEQGGRLQDEVAGEPPVAAVDQDRRHSLLQLLPERREGIAAPLLAVPHEERDPGAALLVAAEEETGHEADDVVLCD